MLGIPTIHTFHGFRYKHLNPVKKFLYLLLETVLAFLTDHHICVGEGEKKRTLTLPSLNEKKITVIPNGVDTEAIQKKEVDRVKALAELGLRHSTENIVLGTVCRVTPEKDIIKLLAAFSWALKANPHLQLLIIGGYPREHKRYQKQVEAYITERGIANKVFVSGYRQDAIRFIKCFDIFVSSSLTEGLPLSLLEALAAGIPVVATNISGNKDVINNNPLRMENEK